LYQLGRSRAVIWLQYVGITSKRRLGVLDQGMRHRKIPMSEKLRKALDDVGGEPLEGSGFERETPAPEFSESEPAAPEPLRPGAR
jgi:hypothetical protein